MLLSSGGTARGSAEPQNILCSVPPPSYQELFSDRPPPPVLISALAAPAHPRPLSLTPGPSVFAQRPPVPGLTCWVSLLFLTPGLFPSEQIPGGRDDGGLQLCLPHMEKQVILTPLSRLPWSP